MKLDIAVCSVVLILCACSKSDPAIDCPQVTFQITPMITPPSSCSTSDARVQFEVTGGVQPYRFTLNTGSTTVNQATPSFSGLFPGKLSLKITDANNCGTLHEFEIKPTSTSGISYNSVIKPLLEKHCNISTCHDGSLGPDRDWRTWGTVQKKLNNFQRILALKKMPPPPNALLSETDTNSILCWIADGALNN